MNFPNSSILPDAAAVCIPTAMRSSSGHQMPPDIKANDKNLNLFPNARGPMDQFDFFDKSLSNFSAPTRARQPNSEWRRSGPGRSQRMVGPPSVRPQLPHWNKFNTYSNLQNASPGWKDGDSNGTSFPSSNGNHVRNDWESSGKDFQSYLSPSSSSSQRDWDPQDPQNSAQRLAAGNFPPALHVTIQKTRLCVHLTKGRACPKRDCSFAHSATELRQRPDLLRTKLCRAFAEHGMCENGNECRFAHGLHELRHTKEFYKTALCAVWRNQGACKAAERCRFAHGPAELRPSPQTPRLSPHLSDSGMPTDRPRMDSQFDAGWNMAFPESRADQNSMRGRPSMDEHSMRGRAVDGCQQHHQLERSMLDRVVYRDAQTDDKMQQSTTASLERSLNYLEKSLESKIMDSQILGTKWEQESKWEQILEQLGPSLAAVQCNPLQGCPPPPPSSPCVPEPIQSEARRGSFDSRPSSNSRPSSDDEKPPLQSEQPLNSVADIPPSSNPAMESPRPLLSSEIVDSLHSVHPQLRLQERHFSLFSADFSEGSANLSSTDNHVEAPGDSRDPSPAPSTHSSPAAILRPTTVPLYRQEFSLDWLASVSQNFSSLQIPHESVWAEQYED